MNWLWAWHYHNMILYSRTVFPTFQTSSCLNDWLISIDTNCKTAKFLAVCQRLFGNGNNNIEHKLHGFNYLSYDSYSWWLIRSSIAFIRYRSFLKILKPFKTYFSRFIITSKTCCTIILLYMFLFYYDYDKIRPEIKKRLRKTTKK